MKLKRTHCHVVAVVTVSLVHCIGNSKAGLHCFFNEGFWLEFVWAGPERNRIARERGNHIKVIASVETYKARNRIKTKYLRS